MSEAELKSAFEARIPILKALGEWVKWTIVESLCTELGSESAVEQFFQIPPKPRVKTTESFLEKALVRKPKPDPLAEITDQVGVRFVVLLLEDIQRVCKTIEAGPWSYEKDRDFLRERLEKAEAFAYQSDHYVIKTRHSVTFRGTEIPPGIPCEVQIRTILQHAYAEMAHGASYKPPAKLPDEDQKGINRALAKGAALIETTDDVFKEIQEKLHEHNKCLDTLLLVSHALYEEIVGRSAPARTKLGEIIADTYRDLLKHLDDAVLHEWINGQSHLREVIRSNADSTAIFRDSSVIILAWLVAEHTIEVPKRWPLDAGVLEDFYRKIGFSTSPHF